MSQVDQNEVNLDAETKAIHSAFNGNRDFKVETITPEDARALLGRALNADPDTKAIDTYAQAMEAGSWVLNGMPIIISKDGKLLDGVQRLSAIVKSGQAIRTFVARNVTEDILHTIDQHRRRNYQGVLESRGIEDAGTLTRLMSKLIRIENGTLGRENISISWSRYDRVLEANPELINAVKISNRYKKTSLHSTARPVLCFMALQAGKKGQLENFMHQLGDMPTEGLDSPARMFGIQLKLWQSMGKDKRKQGVKGNAVDLDTVLAHAILHFNAYLKGKKLSAPLDWSPDYGMRSKVSVLNGEEVIDRVKATELDFDRDAAPANLGMPVMIDYPGLYEGLFDKSSTTDDLKGATAEIIHSGAIKDEGNAFVRMVEVTPELASKWLDPRINRSNRKTQKNHVAAIARDINAGNWMMNAQPICFTKDPFGQWEEGEEPRLLNGQHRLLAIREAEQSVEIPIAVNIPEEAFATYDTHAKRNVRSAGPKADDRVLIAAARFQYKEDNNIPLSSNDFPTLTSSELMEVLRQHPKMGDYFAQSRRAGFAELGSAGVMTYFLYRVNRENPVLGAEFLEKIETGLNISDSSDPAAKLRRELAKSGAGPRGRSRKEQIEALIAHWQSYIRWADKKGGKSKGKATQATESDVADTTELQEDLF